MFKGIETRSPVKTGSWLYDGRIPCEVRIVPHNIWYGSGDYEDPPDVANDREIPCFYILFHTPVGEPQWAGGGAALTLPEAVAIVERKLGNAVTWQE